VEEGLFFQVEEGLLIDFVEEPTLLHTTGGSVLFFQVEEGLLIDFVEEPTLHHRRLSRFFFQVEEGLLIDFVEEPTLLHVLKISQFVETAESLKSAFEYLLKTKIGEDEQLPEYLSSPGIHYPLQGMCHQANDCVRCDRFITGTNEVKWISKETLIRNQFRLQDHELSVSFKN
jgi:hypothetical protein